MRSTLCSLLLCLCTLPLFAQGDTLQLSFSHEGVERTYLIYVPAAYDGSEDWPLVLNFHGYAIDGFTQMVWSDMNPVADTAHFLVAYPDGRPVVSTTPNIPPEGLGWNVSVPEDTVFVSVESVDEIKYTNALLDHIASNYAVDPARVYATGWSNGGMMSTVLACELPDRIAAIAPVGATGAIDRPCNPDRIMPIQSSRLQGIREGADAYLSKPVSEEELQACLTNLLENRQRIQAHFVAVGFRQKKPIDPFLHRALRVVQGNLQNDTFGIDVLCEEMAVSRTQLHRKLKALTGLSTSKFIRRERIEKAKELLKETDESISQIAFACGFLQIPTFNRAFKEWTGSSPTVYRKSVKSTS